MLNIFCFGDSLVHGEMDDERGGWVDRLKINLFSQYKSKNFLPVKIYNLGIGGETTDGLAKRFEQEIICRSIRKQPSIAILSYGLNDIIIHKQKNRVPVDIFIRHISNCICQARAMNIYVVLTNIIPVPQSVCGVQNQQGDVRYNKDVQLFNNALDELARNKSVKLVDVYRLFQDKQLKNVWANDQVHLNPTGHQWLAEEIEKELKPHIESQNSY